MSWCVCACACVHAHTCVCVHVCMCMCVCVCVLSACACMCMRVLGEKGELCNAVLETAVAPNTQKCHHTTHYALAGSLTYENKNKDIT